VCHEKQDSEILFRNCINDGRWPAVHALQQECANRLKVLCSKGKVLSVGVKRCRKASGKCSGVECKWTTDDVSKGTKSKTKLQVFQPQAGQIVTGKLFTGYRSSGIEVAGTLHRRLYETW